MSDKATMLREMDEAFTDLRAVLREMDEASMLDWVTEEQASRVWRGVLGVRGTLIHIREHTVKRTSRTGASGRLPSASQKRSKQPRAKEWEGVT